MSAGLFEYWEGREALLISFPHSGTRIPASLRDRFTPAALAVPDTDWHVPQLYDFCHRIGASALIATSSRYVIDLNRPPDGTPLYPGMTETGLCPIRTFAGEPLYRPGLEPDRREIDERIAAYWDPYHRRLAESIDTIRTRHGHCILWDAHSIRSRVPAFFDGELPDLNVGTANGKSCSRALESRVMRRIESQAHFSSVMNGRFKGGYITRRYGDPARAIDAVQLEIAQCAYMDEADPTRFDPASAAALAALLHDLLISLLETR